MKTALEIFATTPGWQPKLQFATPSHLYSMVSTVDALDLVTCPPMREIIGYRDPKTRQCAALSGAVSVSLWHTRGVKRDTFGGGVCWVHVRCIVATSLNDALGETCGTPQKVEGYTCLWILLDEIRIICL